MSVHTQTCPNASEHVRTGPNRSDQVQKPSNASLQALKSKKPTDLLGREVEENAEAIRLRELSTAKPDLILADERHKLVEYRHVVTEAEVGSSTTADNAWDYICSD